MRHYSRILRQFKLWWITLLSVAFVAGCNDARQPLNWKSIKTTASEKAKVTESLQSSLATSTNAHVLAWREFLNKWPLVRQRRGFAWYEDLKRFQGDVAAITLIEDRYAFKAILDFETDADCREVNFPKLRFHFAEVKQVIVPPEGAGEGGVAVSFQPNQKWFGLEEWRQLVESDWNFSVIGVNVLSNAPVQNIQSARSTL